MQSFEGKVAVITGAASGIGYGLAERCASEGMKVVLADIEEEALSAAEKKLAEAGGKVASIIVDVSKMEDVERMAKTALSEFGGAHLLCNNAGVGAGGNSWEYTLADWEWVLGVNLHGVIYGIKTFVPIMLEQDTECHIVNTASIEGLWSRPTNAPYQVTKHGVVVLSEVMYYELGLMDANIGVSVLCPGGVNTNILDSWRNRPPELVNPPESIPEITPEMEARMEEVRTIFRESMAPSEVADHVFKAIKDKKLYITTHPELLEIFRVRSENILNRTNPILPDLPFGNPED